MNINEFFEEMKKEIPSGVRFSNREETLEAIIRIGRLAVDDGFDKISGGQSERYDRIKPILNKICDYPPIIEKWRVLVEMAKYVYFAL